MKMLENILETAYNMQEEAEHMFIYQESVLNKSKRKALSVNFVGISEIDGNGSTSSLSRHPLLSVSSVDQVYLICCANKDLWALCAPIFVIVVYCRNATSYFLVGKE